MKTRFIATTAAIAMLAGAGFASAANAQDWTPDQENAVRTQATTSGSQVIPGEDTVGWQNGKTVPEDYEGAEVPDMDGYSYVQDDKNIYVMDKNRKIVHTMPRKQATDAQSQAITPAQGDRVDEAQPTTAN